jgi:chromosome segregation ATPase
MNLKVDVLFSQIEQVERKIQALIDVCQAQQTAIHESNERIKQLEEDLQAKTDEVKRHSEEKALIRTKIDNLLAKLEDLAHS